MARWRLTTHHADPEGAAGLFHRDGFIAIGWGYIGNLDEIGPADNAAIAGLIREKYPENGDSGAGGRSLFAFWNEMDVGDLVLVGSARQRQFVMEVTGEYQHCSGPEHPVITDYFHRRTARVTSMSRQDVWTRPAQSWNRRWPLVRLVE